MRLTRGHDADRAAATGSPSRLTASTSVWYTPGVRIRSMRKDEAVPADAEAHLAGPLAFHIIVLVSGSCLSNVQT